MASPEQHEYSQVASVENEPETASTEHARPDSIEHERPAAAPNATPDTVSHLSAQSYHSGFHYATLENPNKEQYITASGPLSSTQSMTDVQADGFPTADAIPPDAFARSFLWKDQFLRLCWRGGWRWGISLLLMAAHIIALYEYEKKDVLQSQARRVFNAIMVGLSLALGLNIASALKEQMLTLRWRILSLKPHSLRVADLVLRSDSVSNQVRLVFAKETPLPLRLGFIFWVLVMILAQIGVATISLTYTLDNYYSHVSWTPGRVQVPDLSGFWPDYNATMGPDSSNNLFLAHSYGDLAVPLTEDYDYNMDIDVTADYYVSEDLSTYTYRFRDYLPGDDTQYVVTDRLASSAADCASYQVISGDAGVTSNITYIDDDGKNKSLDLLMSGQASYVYSIPSNQSYGGCGSRCTQIYAFQYADPTTDDHADHFYKCNVTVGEVTNPTNDAHVLSDVVAQLIAGAIGASGYMDPAANVTEQVQSSNRYITGSYWGSPISDDIDGVASLVAQFAIGTLAIMGEDNNKVYLDNGQQPVQGDSLDVKWMKAGIAFGLLAFGQFAIVLVCIIASSMVIVKDESVYSMARLLRPVVEPLGLETGTILTGEQIAKRCFRDPELIYGSRAISDHLNRLDVGPVDNSLYPQRWHPEGRYA